MLIDEDDSDDSHVPYRPRRRRKRSQFNGPFIFVFSVVNLAFLITFIAVAANYRGRDVFIFRVAISGIIFQLLGIIIFIAMTSLKAKRASRSIDVSTDDEPPDAAPESETEKREHFNTPPPHRVVHLNQIAPKELPGTLLALLYLKADLEKAASSLGSLELLGIASLMKDIDVAVLHVIRAQQGGSN